MRCMGWLVGWFAYRWSRRARSGWTWPSACRRRAWTAAARPRRPGRPPCTRRRRSRPPGAGGAAAPTPTPMAMPPAHASSSCARGWGKQLLCFASAAVLWLPLLLCNVQPENLCLLVVAVRACGLFIYESRAECVQRGFGFGTTPWHGMVRARLSRLGPCVRPESPVPTAAVSLTNG